MNAAHRLKAVVKKTVLALLMLSLATGYPVPVRGSDPIKDVDNNVVQLVMDYKVHLTGRTDQIRLVTLVPKNIENKQQVLSINYSLPPTRLFESDGNLYAEYVVDEPRGDFDIRIDAAVALHRFDLSTAGAMTAHDADLSAFLKDERFLEKDSPEIAAIARTITGRDEMDTIRKIYDYVTSTLCYKGYVREDVGAARVLLERKYGDCSDFSDALVTLARAKNIPARTIDGFLTEYSENNPRHTWVEIYTARYGWVPFDPLLGNLRQATFDRLTPKYIYLSDQRNDMLLNGYHFFSATYSGSPISITDDYSIRSNDTRTDTPLTRI